MLEQGERAAQRGGDHDDAELSEEQHQTLEEESEQCSEQRIESHFVLGEE